MTTWKLLAILAVLPIAGSGGAALAAEGRAAILDGYLAQAKRETPGFAGFSAARGEAFYRAKHGGGRPDTPACTSCHGPDPRVAGQQERTGKVIEPMAVSRNPSRFTDRATVEKWFLRNCKGVLGRECTAQEKGDFISYLASQ
jgi:hypothetical protein